MPITLAGIMTINHTKVIKRKGKSVLIVTAKDLNPGQQAYGSELASIKGKCTKKELWDKWLKRDWSNNHPSRWRNSPERNYHDHHTYGIYGGRQHTI